MSACDYKPAKWDWEPCVKGATMPAAAVTESEAASTLTLVEITIEAYGTDTEALSLTSANGGVTINDATPGNWDYTINAISAATTGGLSPGYYDVTHKVTDNAGVVTFVSKGTWQILAP